MFIETTNQVRHTHIVLEQADQVASIAKDLQLCNRDYLITGDSGYLHHYNFARRAVVQNLSLLGQLTIDSKEQRARIDSIKQQIRALIIFSDQSIRKSINLQLKEADELIRVKQRRHYLDSIYHLIHAIKTDENRLLLTHKAANGESQAKTERTSLILFFSIILFISVTFLFVHYQLRKRQKAESAVRESDQRFRLLINNLKDYAIYMIDNTGHITSWYQGAIELKGYSQEEIIGKHIASFYTEEEVAQKIPERNLQLAKEKGRYETEGWRIKKDGTRFWASIIYSPVLDKQGNIQGYTAISRDETLQKKAKEEINRALEKEKELNEMKSNFVSIASHEFRTPLSTILSSVSLLNHYTTTEQQEKRNKHLKRIQSSVNDLVSILEEFLSLEKIEEGKFQLKNEKLNLKELTAKICHDMKSISKSGQLLLHTHEGEETVRLDPAVIRHILTNLTSNAIKYSPEGSLIEVRTKVLDGYITMAVIDKGIGISEEDQKHLFERFYRASNVTGIQGTGLGLHIVQRYVEQMHGTIKVTSNLNAGSEFTIQVEN